MSDLAAAVAGLAGLGTRSATAGVAQEPVAAVSAADDAKACGLTAEQPRGPYYIDGMLRWRTIVEDRVGVPLALNLLDLGCDATRLDRGVSGRLTLGVDPQTTSNGDRAPRPLPTSTPMPSSSPPVG